MRTTCLFPFSMTYELILTKRQAVFEL